MWTCTQLNMNWPVLRSYNNSCECVHCAAVYYTVIIMVQYRSTLTKYWMLLQICPLTKLLRQQYNILSIIYSSIDFNFLSLHCSCCASWQQEYLDEAEGLSCVVIILLLSAKLELWLISLLFWYSWCGPSLSSSFCKNRCDSLDQYRM